MLPARQVEIKLVETIELLEGLLGRPLKRPIISYDLKGNRAGAARGGQLIRLNLDLLHDPRYTERMVNQTLPHEIAHCVCNQLHPGERVAHGLRWREIMRLLGLPAERCHTYETTPTRKPTARPHEYRCDCPNPHFVTITLHRRMHKFGMKYHCKKCKGLLKPV